MNGKLAEDSKWEQEAALDALDYENPKQLTVKIFYSQRFVSGTDAGKVQARERRRVRDDDQM